MTLGELLRNIQVEGAVKIQSWYNEEVTIHYEDCLCGAIPVGLDEYLDRDVKYMFPYTLGRGRVLIGGICIELADKGD